MSVLEWHFFFNCSKLLYEESAAVSDMCNMIAHNCTVQHADNMYVSCVFYLLTCLQVAYYYHYIVTVSTHFANTIIARVIFML